MNRIRLLGRYDIDRGTLRSAGFTALLTVVFLVTNTAVAAAADGTAQGGGLLGPLDIITREGVPLSGYRLESSIDTLPVGEQVESAVLRNGLPFDVIGETQRLCLNGLFTLVRLLVGLCCWLLRFVFDFPLLTLLTDPAQRLADAYQRHVVGALGLAGLLLGWAFIFGAILFVRGRVGKGLGEITLTLVISALAASAFIRPDYVLGEDGPLQQTHQAAIEVASITTSSYFDTPGRGGRPCDSAVGSAHEACVNEQADAKTVTTPIQNALTDALVVKPYMLLQYGRVLDPKGPGESAAYRAHLKWIKSNAPKPTAPVADGTDPCALLDGPSLDHCRGQQAARADKPEDSCRLLFGSAKDYCLAQAQKAEPTDRCSYLDPQSEKWCRERNNPTTGFPALLKDLQGAGPVGRSAAAYAEQPSWDRVWSVLALLVAVIVVALMIVSMAVVMLGAQGADAAAAAAGPVAWVWAMLPGPSRMVLWRWLGVFVVSALVAFMAAMALPLFGIAVDALLADTGPDQMVERLLLVDALALAFLVLHRRILTATAGFGQRMAMRMQFAKVGGSHLRGDNSEFGAALALHGPAGRSGGLSGRLGGGLSSAHGAFGDRLRSLGSFAALTDGAGMPMSPGRFLGDAAAEGRRGIAPLAIALRGAHAALIGPKPGQHPAAAHFHNAASVQQNGASGGEMVVDQWSGEILHDPATDRPLLGSRIHARASRLRGYRIASGTARLAYGATVGLPRTLSAAQAAGSEFTDDARTQLRVAGHHLREDTGRWADGGRAVRDRVDHTGQVLATAWQVHDPAGTVRDAAIAGVIRTAPLDRTRQPAPRTTTASISRPRPGTVPPSRAVPDRGIPPHRIHAAPGSSQDPAPRRRIRPQATVPAPAPAPAPADVRADRTAANSARLRRIFEARAAERRQREERDGQ
ncbi:hypothetical protein [Streptomyces sp. NPDC002044]|uniref:hypothetical protein n=1 Tax=Streptomyces sp. NPDC002044 TaxID=3154662 RepID=UPI003321CEA0